MTQSALFTPEPDDDAGAREARRGPRIRPPGYQLARCGYGCGARVVWVRLVDALGQPKTNPKTGRPSMMLVNLGTVPDGNVLFTGAGKGRVLSPREYRDPEAMDLYEPHARTCRKSTNTNTEVPTP